MRRPSDRNPRAASALNRIGSSEPPGRVRSPSDRNPPRPLAAHHRIPSRAARRSPSDPLLGRVPLAIGIPWAACRSSSSSPPPVSSENSQNKRLRIIWFITTEKRMGDWASTHRLWEKWASNNIGSSGEPLKAALLLNYDPTGPSRLLSVIGKSGIWQATGFSTILPENLTGLVIIRQDVAEQEGIKLKAVDLLPFLEFVKQKNWQMEFFSLGQNQYLVTSIHEHWFCARCVNTSKPGGEGVIVMQTGTFLLVAMYEGSLGSASQAMVAVDQLAWQMSRRTH